jgi:hypothetical protein
MSTETCKSCNLNPAHPPHFNGDTECGLCEACCIPVAADSLDALIAKFEEVWLRGRGWRLELGEVLYQIKERCEYGEWAEFLSRYDMARSTADDYVRVYKHEAEIAESRQFEEPNPEPEPDSEAEERDAEIEAAAEERKGKRPQHNPTQIRPTLKGLRPDQTARYWQLYAEQSERERIASIWHLAFLSIIGEGHIPPASEPEAEEAECSAS